MVRKRGNKDNLKQSLFLWSEALTINSFLAQRMYDRLDTSYGSTSPDNMTPIVDNSQFILDGDHGVGGHHEDHVGLDVGGIRAPGEEDEEEEEYEEEEEEEEVSMFSREFYQRMFDVDTVDVIDRIFRAMVPFRKNFLESAGARPDLYGLVWVCSTLVFVLASAGNFTNFVRHFIYENIPFVYDFNKLPYGALAVFLYVLIVPLLLWGILAWIDDFELSLVQAYCLYGYAMFPFIPAALISIAPFNAVKWTVISVAGAISFVHIALSLWDILSLRRLVQIIALVLIFAAHLAITLAFALYFFKFTFTAITPPAAPTAPVAAPAPVASGPKPAGNFFF